MRQLSFASLPEGGTPPEWRFPTGAWGGRALSRPTVNRARSVVVRSERHVAFPGICKTRSGALLVVYREGYAHASGNPDDGRIMLTRSCDGGRSWKEPSSPTTARFDDRNAAISCMRDGTVVLIWDKYLHGKHHWAWLSTSQDEGRSWSPAIRVSDTQDVHTRSPAIDLGNGKWLIPYSESTDSPTVATFFSHFDPASHAFDEVAVTPRGQRNIADEVCVTRAPNGDLVALIRSNTDPVPSRSPRRRKNVVAPWCAILAVHASGSDHPGEQLACGFSFRERRNERLVVSRKRRVLGRGETPISSWPPPVSATAPIRHWSSSTRRSAPCSTRPRPRPRAVRSTRDGAPQRALRASSRALPGRSERRPCGRTLFRDGSGPSKLTFTGRFGPPQRRGPARVWDAQNYGWVGRLRSWQF